MADEFKITKEDLNKLQHGTKITGNILVKQYDIKLQKNGQEFVTGTLHAQRDIQFKVWGSNTDLVSLFKNNDYKGKVINIDGEGNSFNNSISIILNDIGVDGIMDTPDDFLVAKYDVNAYFTALENLVKAVVSEKGYDIAKQILFENNEIKEKFKVGYAASTHHDNCRGGLLAHTYKVTRMMAFCLEQYPNMFNSKTENYTVGDKKDLMILGSLFHDLGKVREMEVGVYTAESVAKHQYLGVEMLYPYKDKITTAYGEQWWYMLCSILLQHHGQYGEPPATIAAYMVHIVDMLDSRFTSMSDMINENPDIDKIYYDDMLLKLIK